MDKYASNVWNIKDSSSDGEGADSIPTINSNTVIKPTIRMRDLQLSEMMDS